MTTLEVILMVLLVLWAITIWGLDRSLTAASAELDYTRKLYADATERLEAVTRERDYYKREWAAKWDDWARRAVQWVRHVGAEE